MANLITAFPAVRIIREARHLSHVKTTIPFLTFALAHLLPI